MDPLANLDAFRLMPFIMGVLAGQVTPTIGSFLAFGLGEDTGLNELKNSGECLLAVGYLLTFLIALFFVLNLGFRWIGVGMFVGILARFALRYRFRG